MEAKSKEIFDYLAYFLQKLIYFKVDANFLLKKASAISILVLTDFNIVNCQINFRADGEKS